MNDEQQARELARWLDAGGRSEPPADVDSEALEAIYAMRPDLAPAPRVSADDILASITSGPLAEADVGGTVVPFPNSPAPTTPSEEPVVFPTEVPVPANRPWDGRAMGGIAGLVAAAAAMLLVVQVDRESAVVSSNLEPTAVSAEQRRTARKDLVADKKVRPEPAAPTQPRVPEKKKKDAWTQARSVAKAKPVAPVSTKSIGGSAPGSASALDAVADAGELSALAEDLQPGDGPIPEVEEYQYKRKEARLEGLNTADEVMPEEDAVVDADEELDDDLEDGADNTYNTFVPKAEVAPVGEKPAQLELQQPSVGTANTYGGDYGDDAAASASEEEAEAEPTEALVMDEESTRTQSVVREAARTRRPTRRSKKAAEAAAEPPPPPVASGVDSTDAVLASAATLATSDPTAAAMALEPHIRTPVASGQRMAIAATKYALDAGDLRLASSLVERGLRLSSAPSSQRAQLVSLRDQINARSPQQKTETKK